MAIWDSRTFHQNQYGRFNCEDRYAQYVCMLPRESSKYTKAVQDKRKKYFKTLRTTSHWPYPVKVNGLQPRNWGDETLKINYDDLITPNLSKYSKLIEDLL